MQFGREFLHDTLKTFPLHEWVMASTRLQRKFLAQIGGAERFQPSKQREKIRLTPHGSRSKQRSRGGARLAAELCEQAGVTDGVHCHFFPLRLEQCFLELRLAVAVASLIYQ